MGRLALALTLTLGAFSLAGCGEETDQTEEQPVLPELPLSEQATPEDTAKRDVQPAAEETNRLVNTMGPAGSEMERSGLSDHTNSAVTNMKRLDAFADPVETSVQATTNIQRVVTPGGLEAWLVEEYAVPLIAVEIGFKGAARRDPQGKEGLAMLMSSLLNEGAGELDSQAFLTRLDELAIRLGFTAGRDGLYGSVRTLAEKRQEAFDLLRLAVTQPRFDEEPIARMKQEILAGIKRDKTNPRRIASRQLFEQIFGEHPYARNVDGTIESLEALTAEDLRAFHKDVIARDNMKIAVVGAISAKELTELLDKTFADVPQASKEESIPQAQIPAEGQLIVVERTQPQSVATFASPGIGRDDPDFFPAFVMNYILGGGGFSSRLTDEVREKRGLAYGIYTSFQDYDYGQIFFGSVATDNARISETLEIIRTELSRMRDEGVTEQELADAKTYLTGSFPLRFDSNSKIANQLVSYQLTGRGIDYIDTRNDMVKAVTGEDIQHVAKRLLNPDALSIVVVGQPEGLTPDKTFKAPGEPE